MVKVSGNPKTPQFATGALGAPKSNSANKSVTYGWSGRGDLNARPPAPKTLDPLICASIDSTTCGPCLLGFVETLATIRTAKLQFGPQILRQNPRDVLLELPVAKSISVGRTCCCSRRSVPRLIGGRSQIRAVSPGYQQFAAHRYY